MLKEELESLIGQQVTGDQYDLINHVYMWHPADFSKQSIANLWKMGGQEIFKELTPAADHMCALETHISQLKQQLSQLKQQLGNAKANYDSIKAGYMNNAQD